MTENKKTTDKLSAVLLIALFLIYYLWTATPYVTIKMIGVKWAILAMIALEFMTAILSYALYLRKLNGFSIKASVERGSIVRIFFAITLISAIQIAAHCIRYSQSNHPTELDALSIIVIAFIAPIYEEIFYRGCLFNGVSAFINNKIISAFFVSLTFSLMHTQYYNIIDQSILFTVSMILVYIRVVTNGLFYPFLTHACMNLLVIYLAAIS